MFANIIPTSFSISSKMEKSIWNMMESSPMTMRIERTVATKEIMQNNLGFKNMYQIQISLSTNPPQLPSLSLFSSECIFQSMESLFLYKSSIKNVLAKFYSQATSVLFTSCMAFLSLVLILTRALQFMLRYLHRSLLGVAKGLTELTMSMGHC